MKVHYMHYIDKVQFTIRYLYYFLFLSTNPSSILPPWFKHDLSGLVITFTTMFFKKTQSDNDDPIPDLNRPSLRAMKKHVHLHIQDQHLRLNMHSSIFLKSSKLSSHVLCHHSHPEIIPVSFKINHIREVTMCYN